MSDVVSTAGTPALIGGRILAMFVVMLAGWAIRRARLVTDEMVSRLAGLLIDVIFPALVVAQLTRVLTWEALPRQAGVMAIGAVLFAASGLAAWLLALRGRPGERRTVTFLAAVPNWIFMPLPIVEALYGDAGTQSILMMNVPMQILLWTAGVAWLHGGLRGEHPVAYLVRNRGLQATALGLIGALALPAAETMRSAGAAGEAALFVGTRLLDGLTLLGSLTVPLSLLVTGAQMGMSTAGRSEPLKRLLAGVALLRLVAIPLACYGLLRMAIALGWITDLPVAHVAFLVCAMPVAVSCSSFTERFGGDTLMAARAIVITTCLGGLTVSLLSLLPMS